MTIFCFAFYVSYYALCSLDLGSRHRSPLGLDIACTLCTVGWPSRHYFTNSGMKDFTVQENLTQKCDCVSGVYSAYNESTRGSMFSWHQFNTGITPPSAESKQLLSLVPSQISQTYYHLILSSKQENFVMFFYQIAKILQNIMYSSVGQKKEVNIMFPKDLYFVCNILKSGNLQQQKN